MRTLSQNISGIIASFCNKIYIPHPSKVLIINRLHILLVILLFTFVSCTQKIDENNSNQHTQTINFDSPIVKTVTDSQTNTKKSVSSTDGIYPTELKFKVFAKKYSGAFTLWSEGSDYFTNEGTVVEYDEQKNGWTSSTPYYWPKGSSTLAFSAYSPYNAENTTIDENGVNFTNYTINLDAGSQCDLLYSDRVINQKFNVTGYYYGVQIPFRHSLAQIIFSTQLLEKLPVTSDPADPENDDYIKITEISLKQVNTKASFSQGYADNDSGESLTADWAEHSILGNYANVVKDSDIAITTTKNTDNFYSILVLPQDFEATSSIYIKYNEKKNGVITNDIVKEILLTDLELINGDRFMMGKKYIIDIHYGKQKIFFTPHIGNWSDVNLEGGIGL